MSNGFEQDSRALRRDWETVGVYLAAAMQEVSTELGGEELGVRVATAAVSDGILPNPAALKLLEETYPGSAETVMGRMEQLQQESHQRELAEIRKPILRKYGRAMLDGFTSFNIFGNLPQRRR